MGIFKRGEFYYIRLTWNGQKIIRSTHQGNAQIARDIEAVTRSKLAQGDYGILAPNEAPTLEEFSEKFIAGIQVRVQKENTIAFYESRLKSILKTRLRSTRLDRIDEALLEEFVQERRGKASIATINRELSTLRRLLRLAYEWKLIHRVPKIRLLPGERQREYVLPHADEARWLSCLPQPLQDIETLMLDTGMRLGEVLALEPGDIDRDNRRITVRSGKTKSARRTLAPRSQRSWEILNRRLDPQAPRVFLNPNGHLPLIWTLDAQHKKLRKALGFPGEFVPHSLRHTFLTRLGEAGADAFQIQRIAGHSSILISQRYVHPSKEFLDSAFERLEELNERKGNCSIVHTLPGRGVGSQNSIQVKEPTPSKPAQPDVSEDLSEYYGSLPESDLS